MLKSFSLLSKDGYQRQAVPRYLFFLVVFVLVSVCCFLLINSSLCRVRDVEVSGLKTLTSDEVITHAGIVQGDHFSRVVPAEIRIKLKSLAQVKDAEIRRVFPGKLKIEVTEKKLAGVLYNNRTARRLILEDGVLIPDNSVLFGNNLNLPAFLGWEEKQLQLRDFLRKWWEVPEELRLEFISVKCLPKDYPQVEVRTKNKHSIFLQIDQMPDNLKLYAHFLKHQPGEVHILDSIWFSPKR